MAVPPNFHLVDDETTSTTSQVFLCPFFAPSILMADHWTSLFSPLINTRGSSSPSLPCRPLIPPIRARCCRVLTKQRCSPRASGSFFDATFRGPPFSGLHGATGKTRSFAVRDLKLEFQGWWWASDLLVSATVSVSLQSVDRLLPFSFLFRCTLVLPFLAHFPSFQTFFSRSYSLLPFFAFNGIQRLEATFKVISFPKDFSFSLLYLVSDLTVIDVFPGFLSVFFGWETGRQSRASSLFFHQKKPRPPLSPSFSKGACLYMKLPIALIPPVAYSKLPYETV